MASAEEPRRFSRKIKYALLALLIVAIVLSSSFWVILPNHYGFWPFAAPLAMKPNIGPIQPPEGYYLPYWTNATSFVPSRIFVVSTNITSGSYPYPTRSFFNSPKGPPVVEKGEPCVIINVIIRNDYSAQNPPPYSLQENSSLAWVFLSAEIFNGQNQINSTDLIRAGNPPDSVANAALFGGENATLSIYLATTSRLEVTGFQIFAVSLAGEPPL